MRFSLIALFALLVVPFAFASVDTVEQAKSIVAPYFQGSFSSITVIENPVEIENTRYWVFYSPFSSCFPHGAKNKIITAIEQESAAITCCTKESERTTEAIARIAFESEFMTSCLEKSKLSFTDLINDGSEANVEINSALTALNTLSSQVDAKGYPIDIREAESALEDIRNLNDELLNDLDNGNNVMMDARLYLTQDAMHNAFEAYNDSFTNLNVLVGKVEAYNELLDRKIVETTNSKIPFEDKKQIISTLGSVRELGKYDTSYRRVLSPVLNEFANAEANFQSWRKGSSDGFAFLRAKTDAQMAFDRVEASVQAMFAKEADVESCGINVDQFRKDYNSIRTLMNANQKDAFDAAARKASILSAAVENANDQYTRCVGGTPQAGTKAADNGWVTTALIVIIIAAGGYYFYKKRQEQIAKEDAE